MLKNFIQKHLKTGALVLYRLPGDGMVTAVAGKTQWLKIHEAQQFSNAFLLAPFQPQQNICVVTADDEINTDQNFAVTELRDLNLSINTPTKNEEASTAKNTYIAGVKNALSLFQSADLQKVVLSRKSVEPLPENFSPFSFFAKLTQAYPNAFVYLFLSEETGNWIGATPELLLKAGNNSAETMALAGTAHISSTQKMPAPDEIFTQKEIVEQQLVTNFISETLQPFSAHKTNTPLTEVITAGNLFHLCSRFKMEVKPSINPIKIAEALHPTPAVCGLPRQKALNFLAENEEHNREFYSGWLGPIKNNNLSLYVNLRCMRFNAKNAVFYAGAGIVPGSDAEKEWQETGQKMNTLRTVLYS